MLLHYFVPVTHGIAITELSTAFSVVLTILAWCNTGTIVQRGPQLGLGLSEELMRPLVLAKNNTFDSSL